MAGNSIPSNHSRKAPPADEIYVNVSLTPALFKAEDVSPPPATVIKLLLVVKFDASLANEKVPSPKGSNSKAPSGPFHNKVLIFSKIELIFFIVFGPTSSAIISKGIIFDDTILAFPFASKDFDTTTSIGSIISQFNFL